MRREPRRVAFRPGELLVFGGLLAYGLGALGYALGGGGFLLACLVLGALATPPCWVAVRRRRHRLARQRAQRRAARIAAHRKLWEESFRDVA